MEVRRPDPEDPTGPDIREMFEVQDLREAESKLREAVAQGATQVTIWPKGRPRSLAEISNAEVAAAVAQIHDQDPGKRALKRRLGGQYINPARQNRKAIARILGCSNRVAREAMKRWRREAAEVAASPALLASVSGKGEARDRGLI